MKVQFGIWCRYVSDLSLKAFHLHFISLRKLPFKSFVDFSTSFLTPLPSNLIFHSLSHFLIINKEVFITILLTATM